MDLRLIPQQSGRLEHDRGIVGKAEIAGETDNEASGLRVAVGIIGRDRSHSRRQRRPIRDEAELVARHAGVTQKQSLGIAADGDDGIEGAKRQRVEGAYRLGRNRPWLEETGHHQHVRKQVVHDQRRAGALEFGGGDHRIRQHERRRHGERHIATLQSPCERQEHANRKEDFGRRAPDQRGLSRHPVLDFDNGRLTRTIRSSRCRTRGSRKHQEAGIPRDVVRDRRHDGRGGALVGGIVLGDDDDFSGLLHQWLSKRSRIGCFDGEGIVKRRSTRIPGRHPSERP